MASLMENNKRRMAQVAEKSRGCLLIAVLLLIALVAPLFAADDLDAALLDAAEKGDAAAVKVLVRVGANVNAKVASGPYSYRAGSTALSLALQNGHTAIANMLRNAGAR